MIASRFWWAMELKSSKSGGGRTNVIGRMMTSLTVCVGVGVGGDETLDGKWVNTRLEGEMVSSGWTIDGAIFCWTGQSNFRPKKCLKNLNIWHRNSLRLQCLEVRLRAATSALVLACSFFGSAVDKFAYVIDRLYASGSLSLFLS